MYIKVNPRLFKVFNKLKDMFNFTEKPSSALNEFVTKCYFVMFDKFETPDFEVDVHTLKFNDNFKIKFI